MSAIDFENRNCPAPIADPGRVLLGHGSGGRLSAELLKRVFLPAFPSEALAALEDQATVRLGSGPRVAFTTDSYVVRPIFFPGGDIGRLAVCGTINDLSVGGALPMYLSAAFILEEGLPIAELNRVVVSMQAACVEAGVAMVTGDTKVVDRGKCDAMFITTTGMGLVPDGVELSIHNARPGDRIVVSGPIGDHGIAVMSAREGLEFETELKSDCAPLADLTRLMLEECPAIRCMRDPTRGGLASALNELAAASRVGVKLVEAAVPIRDEVRAACEMLGFDPLYVACEGRLIAVVPANDADGLVAVMRRHAFGRGAVVIGEIVEEHRGIVTLRTMIGGERVVPLLAGEQLPRIC